MTKKQAVAAGHSQTANAGAEILRAGGNAVDAAIGAAMVSFTAEPILGGLAGGGLMLLLPPGEPPQLLDFFAHTPKKKAATDTLDFYDIHADFGEKSQLFYLGAGSIAVPGVARGFSEAHDRYGRMPLTEIAAHGIRSAKEGLPLNSFQAGVLEIVRPACMASASTRELFTDSTGELLKEGDSFGSEAFADLLETYVREGDRFFYEGEVAHALVELCRDTGHITADDMREYQALWRKPLCMRRQDAQILLAPSPSVGGAMVAHSLAHLPQKPTPLQIVQQMHFTCKERKRHEISGKPRESTDSLIGALYNDGYLVQRGTTHISVIDKDGFAVGLTMSNGEGCGHMISELGLVPNNFLGEPDVNPGGALGWQTDNRLLTMTNPMAIIWPDGHKAILGSGGSSRIRSALTCITVRLIDENMSAEEAVFAPRLHVELDGEESNVCFEDRIDSAQRRELLGAYPDAHPWQSQSMYFGGVHLAISDRHGGVSASGDPRRLGAIAG